MANKLTEADLRELLKIAHDLMYPKEVLNKLKNAKTDVEASNIMRDARINM